MSPAETAKLVAVLLAAFPQSRATIQTSQAYERMLGDLDYAAANAAIERLLASSRFMPSIAEIRETTLAIVSGEQKPGGKAWESVRRAIQREGAYRTPGVDFVFSDAVTMSCVSALGWSELCASELQASDRARFVELYDKLATQERRKQLSDALPAMQRYRAIEADRRKQLEERSGESSEGVFGKVLDIATGREPL